MLRCLKPEHTASCITCKSAGERGWGRRGQALLNSQRKRQLTTEYRVWDTPACMFLLFPAREAGIPRTHSFNKYLLRDLFVLVSMRGALKTQLLLGHSAGSKQFKSGDSCEGI